MTTPEPELHKIWHVALQPPLVWRSYTGALVDSSVVPSVSHLSEGCQVMRCHCASCSGRGCVMNIWKVWLIHYWPWQPHPSDQRKALPVFEERTCRKFDGIKCLKINETGCCSQWHYSVGRRKNIPNVLLRKGLHCDDLFRVYPTSCSMSAGIGSSPPRPLKG